MHDTVSDIGFIGFGEAGRALSQGLREETGSLRLRAYDIKIEGADAAAMRACYATHDVAEAATSVDACTDVQCVFSLVTAAEALNAAKAAAQHPLGGVLFLDCNSCAPNTKTQSAHLIEDAGGRYVDVAIMTPIHPKRHRAPCLIAGPHAQIAKDLMSYLGMKVEIAGDDIGAAAGRKMIRSVMVKGLEALTLECFLAARKFGIADDIMASLDSSYPGFGWPERAPYMIERAMTHGLRRADEMREVENTLRDLGIAPHVTAGIVARQNEVGEMGLNASEIGGDDLAALMDAILSRLPGQP